MKPPGSQLDLSFCVDYVEGGEKKNAPFSSLLAERTVVSVYMRNNTRGCDLQNDDLVARFDEIAAAGVRLIALSRDTCGSHLRCAAKKSIAYPLVSDPDDNFARALDSVIEKKMYGRTFQGPSRSAFLIDRGGELVACIEKVDTKARAAQVLGLIRSVSE